MYHADKYQESNDSLKRFCDKFNAISSTLGGLIVFDISQKENFRDDGKIIYQPDGRIILFDWEKRHSYYDGCNKFQFKTFGQFERKIKKREIELSIQCSKDECCFTIAWHEDFRREEMVNIGSKTTYGREYDGKRFTKEFIEILYSELDKFYNILLKAFTSNKLDSSTFK